LVGDGIGQWERDILDLDAEQMEGRLLRTPVERGLHGVTVAARTAGSSTGSTTPRTLNSPPALTSGDDAVDEDPGISEEIRGLHRAPHHREPQIPVTDQRLHGTAARRPVGADRCDQHDLGSKQPLPSELGQTRRGRLELLPTREEPLLGERVGNSAESREVERLLPLNRTSGVAHARCSL